MNEESKGIERLKLILESNGITSSNIKSVNDSFDNVCDHFDEDVMRSQHNIERCQKSLKVLAEYMKDELDYDDNHGITLKNANDPYKELIDLLYGIIDAQDDKIEAVIRKNSIATQMINGFNQYIEGIDDLKIQQKAIEITKEFMKDMVTQAKESHKEQSEFAQEIMKSIHKNSIKSMEIILNRENKGKHIVLEDDEEEIEPEPLKKDFVLPIIHKYDDDHTMTQNEKAQKIADEASKSSGITISKSYVVTLMSKKK